MELFKNFQMGGLFQAGRRMAPPWGAFRRFTNAYQDPTGTIRPYGRGAEVSNAPTVLATSGASGFTHLGPLASHIFRKGILQLHLMFFAGGSYRGVFSYLGPDGTKVDIMQPFRDDAVHNCLSLQEHAAYMPSGNYTTCTVARKSYMHSMVNTSEFISTKPVGGFTPEESFLMAFDGLRLRGAGLPLPWTHVDPAGVVGAFYTRAVYATIGIDGELILSQYLQQRLSSATRDVYASGYSAFPATPRTDAVGANTFPIYRRPDDHLFEKLITSEGFGISGTNARYFDKRFIISLGTATVTGGELSIVRNSYSLGVDVGDWLMVDIGSPIGTVPATLYMFQVKTLGATTVFQKNIKYLDQNSVTWIDADLNELYTDWNTIDVDLGIAFIATMSDRTFTNLFMILSYSATAASGYVVHDIFPIAWDSTKTYAGRVLTSAKTFKVPWAGVISSLMADWYDDTIVQTTFPPVKGVTNYKDLLVGFDSNAIYYSNIGYGGSTEMVSGLSNLVPNGSEYGDIVAVCGAEGFLLISRERKNFILTGDLAGAFNLDECDLPIKGAYNAKAVSNAWSGQIILINSAGIFSVNSSGAVKDLSSDIKGLFFDTNRDQNLFDKTIFKTLGQKRTDGYDRGLFKIFLEEHRGFVVIQTAKSNASYGITGSNMLVFNVATQKWYEFENSTAPLAEALGDFIYSLSANRAKEDGVMRGTEKQLLATQWVTVDAPSLEKQVGQVKLFGEITPKTTDAVRGLTVGQQNNWANFNSADRTGWITNETYTPTAVDIYEHKKRLNSSKARVVSIILESLPTGSLALEGMEIEGVVVQQGMKT